MKNVLKISGLAVAAYVVLVLWVAFIAAPMYDKEKCAEPKMRIEYIFPAIPLTCWLKEEVE